MKLIEKLKNELKEAHEEYLKAFNSEVSSEEYHNTVGYWEGVTDTLSNVIYELENQ